MDKAICWECIDDEYLREIVKKDGEQLECSACGKELEAFTTDRLGKVIEPVMRQNFRRGEEIRVSGEGDRDYWERRGDLLSFWVQEMVGECHGLEDEIVKAVMAAEHFDPKDGDPPFFDDSENYVENPVSPREYHSEWNSVVQELKHKRRFFNSSAKALFDKLFKSPPEAQTLLLEVKKHEGFVRMLPKGSELFRARTCDSGLLLNEFLNDPYRHVGPPPATKARAGRMNAEGVAVFYGAMDADTCIAEMRPPLGGDTAVLTLRTTKALRVLDFKRLEESGGGDPLSYFQPDFAEQARKLAFRRRLHELISQPVTPGKEADYLITQTMAEYLAHVHEEPFDGVSFASVQRDKGTNIVLFPDHASVENPGANTFPLESVEGSLKLFTTEMIEYKHTEKRIHLAEDDLFVGTDPDDFTDGE